MSALLSMLAHAQPAPLVAAVACYLLGAIAIGLRARQVAGAIGNPLSLLDATAIGLSSVLASHVALGAAAGEAVRVAWLARFAPAHADRTRRALCIIALDRTADGAAISGLVLLTLGRVPGARALLLPLALGVVALVVLTRLAPLVRPGRLLRAVLAALPAALAAWALDLARLHLVGLAVGATLDARALAVLALAALVGGQAPTPAGLGAVEGAMIAAGAELGLPMSPLVATVVLDRGLTLTLGTALGALASTHLARTPRRIA